MTVVPLPGMAAWPQLEEAVHTRRRVALRYHGSDRVVCPHALGFKGARLRVLAYQVAGTTSAGTLPVDPNQRWRCLFVDEIEAAVLVDGPWQTAPNYIPGAANSIDHLIVAVDL